MDMRPTPPLLVSLRRTIAIIICWTFLFGPGMFLAHWICKALGLDTSGPIFLSLSIIFLPPWMAFWKLNENRWDALDGWLRKILDPRDDSYSGF